MPDKQCNILKALFASAPALADAAMGPCAVAHRPFPQDEQARLPTSEPLLALRLQSFLHDPEDDGADYGSVLVPLLPEHQPFQYEIVHAATAPERLVGMASMRAINLPNAGLLAGAERLVHVTQMPWVLPSASSQRFDGLEIAGHLLTRQLQWLEDHAYTALLVATPLDDARRNASRWVEMGGRLAEGDARRLGLTSDMTLVQVSLRKALRWLQARAVAWQALEQAQRTSLRESGSQRRRA